MSEATPIVISIGGSLIVPDQIDTTFLSNLHNLLTKQIAVGKKFIIISGGGKTARRYQAAAETVVPLTKNEIDWVGIHSTRLNAQLLHAIFGDLAEREIVYNPNEVFSLTKPILIAGGWKPGWSTDYVAVLLAKKVGANKLINLSNIDYVYTSDPRTNPDAKPLNEIAWADFRKMIPETWDPGLNSPFDPIASKEAELDQIEVAVINGTKLENIELFLHDQPFVGTKIF